MKRIMHQGSTLFLRSVIWFIGAAVLALCIFALPAGISSDNTGDYRPILLGLYVPAIPFFFALYQALKLLQLIDKNKAFSEQSVNAFKNIKYCGVVISVLFLTGMPFIFTVAQQDDAPGVAALGFVIMFASLVVATAAAVFQQLVQNVLNIKSENELTV